MFENERNPTLWPSPEIAGTRLSPFEGSGAVPPGWLATAVAGVHAVLPLVLVTLVAHVLRTKTFSIPFATVLERFEAFVENATNCPVAQRSRPAATVDAGVFRQCVCSRFSVDGRHQLHARSASGLLSSQRRYTCRTDKFAAADQHPVSGSWPSKQMQRIARRRKSMTRYSRRRRPLRPHPALKSNS